MIHLTALAAAALLLCANPARAGEPALPGPGKPAAPVAIAAEAGPESARVALQFEAEARDATVRLHGANGLQVTSPAAVPLPARIARGGSVLLNVGFRAPPGRSHLVISVVGRFGGRRLGTVRSFAVGAEDATARAARRLGRATADAQGLRVKVLPAEPR